MTAQDRLERTYWAEHAKKPLKLVWTPDGQAICPVCGVAWGSGAGHAWVETEQRTAEGLTVVTPSYWICPVCNTEFGNDDMPAEGETLEESWAWLRDRWLERVGRSPDVLERLRKNLGVGE